MSLKHRLIFTFSMMIALSILLGTVLIGSSYLLRSKYVLYENQRRSLDILNDLEELSEKLRRTFNSVMVGLETEREKMNALAEEFNETLRNWKEIAKLSFEKKELEQMETLFKTTFSAQDQVFLLLEKGRKQDALLLAESSVFPKAELLKKKIKELSAEKKRSAEQLWNSAQSLANRTAFFSIALLFSVVLVGAGFAVLLYQAVSRPLAKLREGTKEIAKGNWKVKLSIAKPQELAELAQSFESMADSLSALQAQVVQMDRMSAVGTLAGGVAHEINNPLSGVLGQAQLLLEKMSPQDPNRANVEKIERAAQKCRKIVKGLLDFSRPQDYSFSAVEVDSLIASAISFCESEILSLGIELRWERNSELPPLPKIWASPQHLQQVFLNILTNAMQAMPEGGTLSIKTEMLSLSERNFIEISFSDTGIGIAPEDLPRIFDPFFTTKEVGKGTGLGLTISYGIIQQHSGEILVESEGKGRGATFRVRIPVAREEKMNEVESSHPLSSATPAPSSVLKEIEKIDNRIEKWD